MPFFRRQGGNMIPSPQRGRQGGDEYTKTICTRQCFRWHTIITNERSPLAEADCQACVGERGAQWQSLLSSSSGASAVCATTTTTTVYTIPSLLFRAFGWRARSSAWRIGDSTTTTSTTTTTDDMYYFSDTVMTAMNNNLIG
jgi:hypothetical protein